MRRQRVQIDNGQVVTVGLQVLTECVFTKVETDPKTLDARRKGDDECQNQHIAVVGARDD